MTMSLPLLSAAIAINVNGSALPAEQFDRLAEVSVEQSLHLPSMCTLRLHDVGRQPARAIFFNLLDQNAFAIGAELEVSLGRIGDPEVVFQGEITAVELEAATEHMPRILVRAYDRAHRLLRGRRRPVVRQHGRLGYRLQAAPRKSD